MNNAIDHIRTYLNSNKQDYQEGIALLLSYGNKPATANLLMLRNAPVKLIRLLNEVLDKLKLDNPQEEMQTTEGSPEPVSGTAIAIPEKALTAAPLTKGLKSREEEKLWAKVVVQIKKIEPIRQQLYWLGRNAISRKTRPLSEEEQNLAFQLSKTLVGEKGINVACLNMIEDFKYLQKYGKQRQVQKQVTNTAPVTIDSGDSYLKKENARKQVTRLNRKIKEAKEKVPTVKMDEQVKLLNKINEWEAQLEVQSQLVKQYKGTLDGTG